MLQHATGHYTDRSLFHKRFEDFPQRHRHPCPSFTGSLLLARGTKLPKNSSTLEGLVLRAYPSRAFAAFNRAILSVYRDRLLSRLVALDDVWLFHAGVEPQLGASGVL